MSIGRLLARCVETAIKLPVAAAWDVISLGNMGEGSSTGRAYLEDTVEALETAAEIAEKAERARGHR